MCKGNSEIKEVERVRVGLYSILILEITWSILAQIYTLAVILALGGLLFLIFHQVMQNNSKAYWISIRDRLKLILIKNKIVELSETPSLIEENTNLLKINNTNLTLNVDPGTVESLRDIGIDGLLICLFLLKYDDMYCSIKSIATAIPIPKTTIYRTIERLIEYNYVQSKNTFDNPKLSYFQLTIDGKYIVFELHRIIKLTT